LGGLWFKANLGKKLKRPHLNQRAGHGGVCLCLWLGKRDMWEVLQLKAIPRQKVKPYLKNNLKAKRAGGVTQVYSPEFKS
jgi:hypothetical protein